MKHCLIFLYLSKSTAAVPSQQCCKIAATTHQQSLTHSLPASLSLWERSCLWVWPSYFFYSSSGMLAAKKTKYLPSFFSSSFSHDHDHQTNQKYWWRHRKKYIVDLYYWLTTSFLLVSDHDQWWGYHKNKWLAAFFSSSPLCLLRGDCLVWTETTQSLQRSCTKKT